MRVLLPLILLSCSTTNTTTVIYQGESLKMPTRTGHYLDVECVGYGLSIDLSRQDAIERCQGSASAYLTRDITVSDENWETSENAYSLTKVSSYVQIKNLECVPLQEKVELSLSNTTRLTCRFDTRGVTTVAVTPLSQPRNEGDSSDATAVDDDVSNRQSDVNLGLDRQLSVTSIPPCHKVTTIGPQGKTYSCAGNPSFFHSHKTDREVVIERDGFLPYRVKLQNESAVTSIAVQLKKEDR